MGSVALTVLDSPAVAEVDERARLKTTGELAVRRADASVDHVDVHARAGVPGRVLRIQRSRTLVDAVQPPRRVVLDPGQLVPLLALDPHHLVVAPQRCQGVGTQRGSEPFDRPFQRLGDRDAVPRDVSDVGDHGPKSRSVLQLDDVLRAGSRTHLWD